MGRPLLTHLQSVVGLIAGLVSIVGAVYSGMGWVKPASHVGEVAAVVRESRTDRPIRDASIEILTADDAVVTTLTPAADGRARYALAEGSYRVRVTHPQFVAETRPVQVRPSETAEVRFQLAPPVEAAGPPTRRARPSPVDDATRTVDAGVGAALRFFRHLGR